MSESIVKIILNVFNEEWIINQLEDFTEKEKDEVFLYLNIMLVKVQLELSIITNHCD